MTWQQDLRELNGVGQFFPPEIIGRLENGEPLGTVDGKCCVCQQPFEIKIHSLWLYFGALYRERHPELLVKIVQKHCSQQEISLILDSKHLGCGVV